MASSFTLSEIAAPTAQYGNEAFLPLGPGMMMILDWSKRRRTEKPELDAKAVVPSDDVGRWKFDKTEYDRLEFLPNNRDADLKTFNPSLQHFE